MQNERAAVRGAARCLQGLQMPVVGNLAARTARMSVAMNSIGWPLPLFSLNTPVK